MMFFPSMKAGYPKILFRRNLAQHNREPSGLRLSRAASERPSKQPWPIPEVGFPGPRGPQLGSGFRALLSSQELERSRLTKRDSNSPNSVLIHPPTQTNN